METFEVYETPDAELAEYDALGNGDRALVRRYGLMVLRAGLNERDLAAMLLEALSEPDNPDPTADARTDFNRER